MSRSLATIWLVVIILSAPARLLAATEFVPIGVLGVGEATQVIVGLILVLVVIVVLAWVYRRNGGFRAAGNPALSVITSMSLSARERLVLVRVNGVQLLLGVAPGQIRTLHVLGKDENPDSTASLQGEADPGFRQLLSNATRAGEKP